MPSVPAECDIWETLQHPCALSAGAAPKRVPRDHTIISDYIIMSIPTDYKEEDIDVDSQNEPKQVSIYLSFPDRYHIWHIGISFIFNGHRYRCLCGCKVL